MIASMLLILLFKSILILGLAGVVTLLLRRHSAASRHVVWTLGIVALVALPIAGAVLPGFSLPERAERVIPWSTHFSLKEEVSPAPIPSSDTARNDAAIPETPGEIQLAPWLVSIWLAGVVLLLVRLAVGFVQIRRIEWKSFEIVEADWLRLADEIGRDLGLDGRPRLLGSIHITSPMTWGLWRPAVVLPSDAGSWPEKQRRIVVAHELAHVRRRDVLVTVIGRIACALYWPNPLVWLAAHRLRVEGEYACDDVVLSLGIGRHSYAEGLLEVARTAGRVQALPALPMARRSEFERRLIALLSPSRVRAPLSGAATRVAWATALCVTVLLAAFRTPGELPGSGAAQGIGGAVAVCEQDRWTTLHAEDPVATERFLRLLLSDDSKDRQEAVNGLGNVGTPEAVPALVAALEDPSDHVRQGAASALGNRGDGRAVAPLIAALDDPDEHVRQSAAGALGDLGDSRALEPLVNALGSPEKHIRQAAAAALGRLGDRRAVAALTTFLADPEPHVVAAAARSLGQLGANTAMAEIARLYESDPNRHVRLASARSLGRLGDNRGVSFLLATLRNDAEQFTRADAAWALGAVGRNPGAEDALLGALDDESRFVQYAAICSLGRIGSETAEAPLLRLVNDASISSQVRAGSEWALRRLAAR